MPSEPADFLTVSEFLVAGSTRAEDDQKKLWLDIEDARARSAISRSYYAVFRVWKHRLIENRVQWSKSPSQFPKHRVHANLLDALKIVLGEKHPIVDDMRSLLRQRNDCDYTFQPALSERHALDEIDVADSLIAEIRALEDATVAIVAFELHRIDAAAHR